MKQGTIYIVSAPSGSGKSSLIKDLINTQNLTNIKSIISYTTRPIRNGEKHGMHYFFVSVEKFKKMIFQKDFLEYAKVFNNYYGTLRKSVEESISNGIDVLLNIDWQGAKQIRKKIKNTKSIFIFPPSKKVLLNRLKLRKSDDDKTISLRIGKSIDEMKHFSEYDYLIINNNFETALINLKTIIEANRLCLKYQILKNKLIIEKLLREKKNYF